MLEHDTDLCANLIGVDAGVGDVHSGEENLAVIDALKQIGAAKEGRLTRARCTQEHNDLVTVNVKI